ncbi:MAG: PIN domain-containing protein, partial [Halodesulfurarchaeum sp.]
MEIVPDTSVIVDGRVSERVERGEFAGATIVVPEAVVGELEHEANDGRDTGWDGLAELETLVEHDEAGTVSVEYVGRRPGEGEIRQAGSGAIDAIIREVAGDRDATLLTADLVQAEVARATGIDVEYVEPRGRDTDALAIEEFFDEQTMSVHLKAGTRPKAKRGDIGAMRFETVREAVATETELKEWSHDVEETAR